eukprot:CAMPEP_0183500528 /NCGR_PEP_ID=MMETSP0371-20130417/2571_1 /TAXON_ID=268820 /ORGANISM="Peridinium aciculiferum, Strain PAER-2" /LENGTH=64 /DNA_ID=CAMNT_0025694651 /DNA_START=66 /DNA_END=256 /DNA_ORIENTATION=+
MMRCQASSERARKPSSACCYQSHAKKHVQTCAQAKMNHALKVPQTLTALHQGLVDQVVHEVVGL